MSNTRNLADLLDSSGDIKSAALDNVTPTTSASDLTSGTIAAARLSTAATQSASDNSTKIATTAYTDAQIATVVDSAPGTLNTLNELAAALGDDASFSTTVTNSIAAKLPLAGGTMTGNISHAGAFTIDTVGDISLDSEGAILIKNGGSAIGRISNSGSDMIIKSDTSDKDILFKGNDGGSTITALKLDMSDAGAATFNSYVDFQGNNIYLADSAKAVFGTGEDLQIYHDSSHSYIKTNSGGGNLKIRTEQLEVLSANGNQNIMRGTESGAVTLYHTNNPKLVTTAIGANITNDSGDNKFITRSEVGASGNWSGGGFQHVANATAGSRRAMMWLDADGGNFAGSDYYYIEKTGGGGVQHILQNNADMKFATNGNDRMSINANGNIGIAENTPIRKFHIAGPSGNGSTMLIHMDADTAGGECGIEFKADSTNDNRRVKAAIKYRRDDPGTRGTGNLHFCVNGDNNDVNVSTSHSRMMLNTDGLHFSGDTAAANALSDYEEGTWTPTLGPGSGQSYSSQVGTYTKVGNVVHCWVDLSLSARGSITGSARILGLPFTPVSSPGIKPGSFICQYMNLPSGHKFTAGVYAANSFLYIWEEDVPPNGGVSQPGGESKFTNNSAMWGSFSYIAS